MRSLLGADRMAGLDNFERVQLAYVLGVCCRSPSVAAASRILFDKSRRKKKSNNDTHRLSQHLQKHGLDWSQIQAAASGDQGRAS